MNKTMIKTMLMFALAMVVGSVWAVGESFSIGIDNGYEGGLYTGDGLYGWEGAQVAGKNWNNTSGASISDMRLNTGVRVSGANFIVHSKGGNWKFNGPAQLGGVVRDYADGQWNIDLEGIPFSQYKIVLFMASDINNKTWGPVKVSSGEEETYYTYTDAKELTTTDAEHLTSWGRTALGEGYTAEEGVNVMVIPELTGDISLLTHGTSGDAATRGSFYAIQIINTGSLLDYEEKNIIDCATSLWNFEDGSILDSKEVHTNWEHNTDNPTFVDSLRKNGEDSCKAVKISGDFHPGSSYTWGQEFTAAAYVDLSKCPDGGAILSFGNTTTLRKENSTTVRFGGLDVYIDATNDVLISGYHLIIVKKNSSGLYIQIDDGEMKNVSNVSTINNGLQLGVKWEGGNSAWNNDGGLLIDDVILWNGIFLTDLEVAAVVAAYPAALPSEQEITVEELKSFSELGVTSSNNLTLILNDGVILTMDEKPDFDKLTFVCDGVATVKKSENVSDLFSDVGELFINGSGGIKFDPLVQFPNATVKGTGKLIIDPGTDETYTMPEGDVNYQVEVVINSGTVKMSGPKCFGQFGRNAAVRVKAGAVLDINGKIHGGADGYNNKLILEEGSVYTNSVSISDPKFYPFYDMTLEGNAVIDASDVASGLTRHYNYETFVNTAGHTLIKTGTNIFYMSAVTITGGGIVDIRDGTLSLPRAYYTGTHPSCDGKVIVGSGATLNLPDYNNGSDFTVNELEIQGNGTVAFAGNSHVVVTNSLKIIKDSEVELSDRYVLGEEANLTIESNNPVALKMNTFRMDGQILVPEGSTLNVVLAPNEPGFVFNISGIQSAEHVKVFASASDENEVGGIVKTLADGKLTVSIAKYVVSENETNIGWNSLPDSDRIAIATDHEVIVSIPSAVVSEEGAPAEAIVEGEGKVVFEIDATNGVTVGDDWKEFIRGSGNVFVFKGAVVGDQSNGARIIFRLDVNKPILSHLVFDGGKHKIEYGYSGGGGSNNFGEGATPDNPTILVKNDTVVDFTAKDLSYWSGAANANGIIRVNDGGKLYLKKTGGNATCYYRQQFYLEPGALLDSSDLGENKFRLQGGSTNAASAVVYVPESTLGNNKPAVINAASGIFLASDATRGVNIEVGEGSKLLIEGAISAAGTDADYVVYKHGAGSLEIKGNVTTPALIAEGGEFTVNGIVANLELRDGAKLSASNGGSVGSLTISDGCAVVASQDSSKVVTVTGSITGEPSFEMTPNGSGTIKFIKVPLESEFEVIPEKILGGIPKGWVLKKQVSESILWMLKRTGFSIIVR